MNFRFATMKDPHGSLGFENRIRFDFASNFLDKLKFTREYCKENQITDMIATGDIIDSSYEDKWTFKKYRLNKRAYSQYKEEGIDFHSNVGNHDLFHGLEDSENTIFGEMVLDGVVNNLTQCPIIKEDELSKIIIQGIDYSNHEKRVLEKIQEVNDQINNKPTYKVIVLHSNVTPDEVTNITDFTYKSLIEKFTDIDMFICGHYHVGYPTAKIKRPNGKEAIFINNWNFVRVVRDYEVELNEHTPEIEDVQINFNIDRQMFDVITKTIEVPHREYKDTFRTKAIDLLKKSKAQLFNFFENISFDEIKENTKQSDEVLIDEFKTAEIEEVMNRNKCTKEEAELLINKSYLTAIEYLNNAKI
jgi:hypothetical protein